MTYTPPIRAAQYLIRHAVDMKALQACPDFQDVSDDLIGDILGGSAAFASEVLAPLNWAGDQDGANLTGDDVIAAPGFKEAYRAFVDGGWQSLAAPTEFGGMGLPQTVSVGANEMLYAANMAFGLCPMLTASSMNAVFAHASDDIKQIYLAKMATGEWTGAMNLTEPQAGSDLGALRTKAVSNGDGTYRERPCPV